MAVGGRSVVGTVLVLVAIALFAVGWRLTESDRFFLLHAARTTGQVMEYEFSQREVPGGTLPITTGPRSLNGALRARFRLVVAFTTASGDRIRFRSISSYGRPPYAVGESVPVRYDAARPTRARIDRRIELLAPVLIWMGAVVLLGATGVAVSVFGPKDARGTSRTARPSQASPPRR